MWTYRRCYYYFRINFHYYAYSVSMCIIFLVHVRLSELSCGNVAGYSGIISLKSSKFNPFNKCKNCIFSAVVQISSDLYIKLVSFLEHIHMFYVYFTPRPVMETPKGNPSGGIFLDIILFMYCKFLPIIQDKHKEWF